MPTLTRLVQLSTSCTALTDYRVKTEGFSIATALPTDSTETRLNDGILYLPHEDYIDVARWGSDKTVVTYRVTESRNGEVEVPSWREVRQLYFALERDGPTSLLPFYHDHGPLGYFGAEVLPKRRDGLFWEPIGWVKAALHVFQKLTSLVEAVRFRRIGLLRETFGDTRTSVTNVRASSRTVDSSTEVLLGGLFGGSYLTRLTWVPPVDPQTSRLVYPRSDDELVTTAWETVVRWYADMFAHLGVLVPSLAEGGGVQLTVSSSSLLEQVVLDYYFQEIAAQVRTCGLCNRPLTPRRRKWCSERCSNRARQQSFRDRTRSAKRSR